MRGDNVGITARRSRSATAAASMALHSPVSSCMAYTLLIFANQKLSGLLCSLFLWTQTLPLPLF